MRGFWKWVDHNIRQSREPELNRKGVQEGDFPAVNMSRTLTVTRIENGYLLRQREDSGFPGPAGDRLWAVTSIDEMADQVKTAMVIVELTK
jgi:hypothetical protein